MFSVAAPLVEELSSDHHVAGLAHREIRLGGDDHAEGLQVGIGLTCALPW